MVYIAVEGAELWCEDAGGDGPPLVLVHGSAGSSECWGEQLPAFTAAGYRCVSYDLRGFGRSRVEAGQDAAGSIAGDLEELCRRLSLPPCFMVAQAYGGFGALELALDRPELLRGLVVSTSFGGVSDVEFTALRARYVPAAVSQLPVEERELGASYRAADPKGVRRFLAMEAGSYRAAEERQQLRQAMTLSRLEAMRMPTLLIAGDEDVLAPPPVMRAIAERIPGCRFEVMAGAGHCAYWEQPAVWNRLVIEFLATLR